ncbi:Mitochondrial porin [Sorochytrium milnesiophthora]
MAPVVFSDIAKPIHDLLGKDYPVGSIKLEAKTTAANGVRWATQRVTTPSRRQMLRVFVLKPEEAPKFNFTVAGLKDSKTGTILGDLKTKYSDKALGLTLTETWSTSNVLSAEVELADNITRGLKLNLHGSLLPHVGQKNARIAAEYKHDLITTRTSLDLFRGPIIHADAAVAHDGIVVGGETAYDVSSGSITRYNFAVGYNARDYSVTMLANNKLDHFSGAYYHRVNKDVEAGAKATWDRKSGSNVSLELGTKYYLDRDAFVKAKIDNYGKLGLGYTQLVRPGVKVSLGGVFDTARLNENVHKVGLSLVLES